MSERELRTLKGEVKNLRQTIVDSLPENGLQDITQILSLLALFKCDPIYKYPSYDFIGMYLYCYMVSYTFSRVMTCIFGVLVVRYIHDDILIGCVYSMEQK